MKAKLFGVFGFVFAGAAGAVCSRRLCWSLSWRRCACSPPMRCSARQNWCATTWNCCSQWPSRWDWLSVISASCRCGSSVMQGLVLVLLFGSFAIELKYHDVSEGFAGLVGVFRRTCRRTCCSVCCVFFQMNYHHGAFIVLLPLLAAWGADTCALFSGMLFGKHKLFSKDGRGRRRRRGRRCRPRADRGFDYEPDA